MTAADPNRFRPTALPLLAWLLSGGLLLCFIGSPPVTRTQEARVLETARQMLPRPWPDWIVPRLNDEVRLQKPPLCYWLTAAAFALGDVSEGVGRVPDALCGWATLALVYLIGRQLFDATTGWLGAGLLLGSYQFFRFTRLAETDGPSSLMVTLAIYALIRVKDSLPRPVSPAKRNEEPVWLHLSALAIAGAALTKGGPAAYPLLFVLAHALIERDATLLKRFIRSGAALTALLMASPWFVYIAGTQGLRVFFTEVDNLTAGKNHFEWPWVYLQQGLVATLPWSGVVIVGLIDAVRRWRTDPPARLLLTWCLAIALPLCCIGNKQPHYLLPMMPPLMLLAGRAIARVTSRLIDAVLGLIILGGIGAAIGVGIIAHHQRGRFIFIDGAAAAVLLTIAVLISVTYLRRGTRPAYCMGILTTAVAMPLLAGRWLGGLATFTPRTVAAEVRQEFGSGPFLFYGPNVSLPLCFNLRQSISNASTVDTLLARSRRNTVVLAIAKPQAAAPPLPPRFVPAHTLRGPEQLIECYRDAGAP